MAAATSCVDAEPVRQHIRRLHAAGFTDRRIAALSGVATETVIGFTRPINRASNRRGVKRTCHPAIASRILAVQVEDSTPGLVDAIGARRRLQALIARGWPIEHVARHAGIGGTHLRLLVQRPRIYGRTAQAVSDTYRQLAGLRPERNGVSKGEATKARRRAAANRWPDPKYWADRMDVIDDPDFQPLYGVTKREIVAQDASELIRWSGLTRETAAERLGVSKSYVEHAFREHPQYAVEVAA